MLEIQTRSLQGHSDAIERGSPAVSLSVKLACYCHIDRSFYTKKTTVAEGSDEEMEVPATLALPEEMEGNALRRAHPLMEESVEELVPASQFSLAV
ncbi:hypothetical protein KSB_29550 [Ktedonobacter robiniae]|uniref:Uncharacterized protein n=1 Tax=Ktedonobacter robiniae TaxID=2778365 RepID=A0ABQ3UP75_9CHLR|nr:hypothetical protein KSB_29550 [Ktedonobacter robiniae]